MPRNTTVPKAPVVGDTVKGTFANRSWSLSHEPTRIAPSTSADELDFLPHTPGVVNETPEPRSPFPTGNPSPADRKPATRSNDPDRRILSSGLRKDLSPHRRAIRFLGTWVIFAGTRRTGIFPFQPGAISTRCYRDVASYPAALSPANALALPIVTRSHPSRGPAEDKRRRGRTRVPPLNATKQDGSDRRTVTEAIPRTDASYTTA